MRLLPAADPMPTRQFSVSLGALNKITKPVPLSHDMNEMTGQLQIRSTVAVETPEPFRTEVVGWSPDKWAEQLLEGADTSAPERANSANTEPDRGRGPGVRFMQ